MEPPVAVREQNLRFCISWYCGAPASSIQHTFGTLERRDRRNKNKQKQLGNSEADSENLLNASNMFIRPEVVSSKCWGSPVLHHAKSRFVAVVRRSTTVRRGMLRLQMRTNQSSFL